MSESQNPHDLSGSTIAQYQIEEELGGGGMGVVYRALDTRLDRPVALKFLPPFLTHSGEARERFFAEARAASKLDHANICTVHEIGETDDGRVFIAMTLYEGETLKKKIERGALPLGQALDYATQAARGLAKAHDKNIVHRDIKPANLMVTEDGVVKIVDFGTAKMGDLQLTATGVSLGTVAYMSPEQLEGESVDRRTDLWSLGVVLYEMLTGRSPFAADRTPAMIYAITSKEPAPLVHHDPALPEVVQFVVSRCLEKAAEHRYADAAELIEDLVAVGQSLGVMGGATATTTASAAVAIATSGTASATTPAAPAAPAATGRLGRPASSDEGLAGRGRFSAGRLAGLALAAAALIALVVPASRNAMLGMLGSGGDDLTYLAVLPFESTDPTDEVMASGLTHSLTGMISSLQSVDDSLWVVPASEIRSEGITTARQARESFDVNTVLAGSVQRSGAEPEIQLELVDAQQSTPRLLDARTLPAPSHPTFQDEVRSALASLLGLGASDEARDALAVDASVDPQAYALYVQGLGFLQRLYNEENIQTAIRLMEDAIVEDSTYALPYAGLCDAYWEWFTDTGDPASATRAIERCDQASALAAEHPVVLVTLASTYLRTGETAKALSVLTRALQLDPDNADAHRWMGRAFEVQARGEDAEAAYQRAIDVRPGHWIYHYDLAILHLYGQESEKARAALEEVIRLFPDNGLGYSSLGAVAVLDGDFDEAKLLLNQANQRSPSAISYRNLAFVALGEQRYEDAIALTDSALALSETDRYSWRWQAHAHHWLGEDAEEREDWERFIDLTNALVAINPDDVDVLPGLAEAHVLLGNEAEGRAVLEHLVTLPIQWNYLQWYVGRVYELLAERDAAFTWIERALDNGLSPRMLEIDRWLDDLRTDPRYGELTSP